MTYGLFKAGILHRVALDDRLPTVLLESSTTVAMPEVLLPVPSSFEAVLLYCVLLRRQAEEIPWYSIRSGYSIELNWMTRSQPNAS